MVVYLDRVFLLNLLVDYLLLLSAAQLSGRTLSRLRLLLCAAGGGLYAVATFLPGCGFLRGPLCQLAAGGAMALCAFRGRRRPALLAAVRRTGGLRTGAGTVGRITHGTAAPHLSGRDELAAAAGRCTLLLFAAASAAGARGTPWRRRTIEDHHICLRTKADRHGAA